MRENVIFCYSGTGNCLDMAKTIARELGDTDIILMRKEPAVTDVREARRVGFIFPCYGGGLPGGVEASLRRIRVGLTAYTFGVCQYAGYMGSGLRKLNSIRYLDYWTAVSHQCSCIWLLPHNVMLPPLSAAAAQRRAEKRPGRSHRTCAPACARKKPRRKNRSTSWRALSGRRSWPARRRSSPSAMPASPAASAPGSARAATSASKAAAPSSAGTASSA